ncbi:hypothetical protein HPB51_008809 [Rhipicephalus microplus]|uniref:Uncharacterized protein n=1 Tax=Rhipicephalus microplus TaxID=6941 RepID=A0A9J6ESC6_RHIMP|nr:hypothetical protein HPB51_008809 [Rhipicephalus microplus]
MQGVRACFAAHAVATFLGPRNNGAAGSEFCVYTYTAGPQTSSSSFSREFEASSSERRPFATRVLYVTQEAVISVSIFGGLQRNGTLRSSTIKKVAPPVVPDSGSAASTGRRHSSSSACTTPVHQLHSPPLYGSSSEEPPPSPTAYDGADQKTFSPAEVFSEAQVAGSNPGRAFTIPPNSSRGLQRHVESRRGLIRPPKR